MEYIVRYQDNSPHETTHPIFFETTHPMRQLTPCDKSPQETSHPIFYTLKLFKKKHIQISKHLL